ncbi:MAG: hypothetical protein WCK86_23550 [Planctomycetia bacterium]
MSVLFVTLRTSQGFVVQPVPGKTVGDRGRGNDGSGVDLMSVVTDVCDLISA